MPKKEQLEWKKDAVVVLSNCHIDGFIISSAIAIASEIKRNAEKNGDFNIEVIICLELGNSYWYKRRGSCYVNQLAKFLRDSVFNPDFTLVNGQPYHLGNSPLPRPATPDGLLMGNLVKEFKNSFRIVGETSCNTYEGGEGLYMPIIGTDSGVKLMMYDTSSNSQYDEYLELSKLQYSLNLSDVDNMSPSDIVKYCCYKLHVLKARRSGLGSRNKESAKNIADVVQQIGGGRKKVITIIVPGFSHQMDGSTGKGDRISDCVKRELEGRDFNASYVTLAISRDRPSCEYTEKDGEIFEGKDVGCSFYAISRRRVEDGFLECNFYPTKNKPGDQDYIPVVGCKVNNPEKDAKKNGGGNT